MQSTVEHHLQVRVLAVISLLILSGDSKRVSSLRALENKNMPRLYRQSNRQTTKGLRHQSRSRANCLCLLSSTKITSSWMDILRACIELEIPVSYLIKDFNGKPLDEIKYVVSVNLHRRAPRRVSTRGSASQI
jgi:hypothetical protein